jgi:predicted nucleic acid-binding protein
VLVDTSVWVDHFRQGNAKLSEQLQAGQVWTHPFVIGELACGSLSQRKKVLTLFSALPAAPLAEHDETLKFIETHQLFSRGLGWIDMHLLVSARIVQLPLWSLDKRLASVARELGLEPA